MDLYLQVQKPTLAPYPTHGWGTKLTKNSVGDGFVGCLDRFYFIGRSVSFLVSQSVTTALLTLFVFRPFFFMRSFARHSPSLSAAFRSAILTKDDRP